MAASLLAMVCGITARSKKHANSKPELDKIKKALTRLRNDLIELAEEDAHAYDLVVEAMKSRKANPGGKADERVQKALERAAEVPMATAEACLMVLETSVRVAELGARSASSDVGVAVLMADAGFKGAAMNVRINAKYITDNKFVTLAEDKLRLQEARVKKTASRALHALSEP
jgi:formiminotetrahydrofolate cyclodeaminase